jgi:glutathione S-transferase
MEQAVSRTRVRWDTHIVAAPAQLFVVHGSHPCACVARALELKGMPYRLVELPPPLHAPVQRLIFGRRTVPGLRLPGGERVSGSRAILRRLEELAPQPPLYPAAAEAKARAAAAEQWGDDVLQPLVRRVLWWALTHAPSALSSYSDGSALPLPRRALMAFAPLLTRAERALNQVRDDAVRQDLRRLPGHLGRVDAWIAEGVLGGASPGAADLQIASSLGLLATVQDVGGLIAPRPSGALAQRLFPSWPGQVPAGVLPPAWLPAAAAA